LVGARDSILKSTQPDLVNPVWGLAWLNPQRVITVVFQYNRNRIIGIPRPAVDASWVNIQPIAHPGGLGARPDLIIHLHPN
jgi:hypothetical protein